MTPSRAQPELLPRYDSMAGTTTLLLVRHAESEANAGGEALDQSAGSPLSAAGQGQALALARAFNNTPVDALITSDLPRAVDTVAPLGQALGKIATTTPLLREPRSGRRSTKFADADAVAALLADLRSPAEPQTTTETHAEVVGRLRLFLTGLQRPEADRVVVVCSHFVTLNVLLHLLLDDREPPARVWAHFDNASVTRVDVPSGSSSGAGVLRYANWTPPVGV